MKNLKQILENKFLVKNNIEKNTSEEDNYLNGNKHSYKGIVIDFWSKEYWVKINASYKTLMFNELYKLIDEAKPKKLAYISYSHDKDTIWSNTFLCENNFKDTLGVLFFDPYDKNYYFVKFNGKKEIHGYKNIAKYL